jgi:hypothetical protein
MPKKATNKEVKIAIIIALIGLTGTIITAVLNSPLLIKWVENTPMNTPSEQTAASPENSSLVFSEDFEDGSASGFGFANKEWTVEKDKSNKVLEVDSTSYPEDQWAYATFGPTDFSSGIIEFKIKYEKVGGFYTIFRANDDAYYVFFLTPSQTILGYKDKAQNWSFTPFSSNTRRDFSTQTGIWYTVRVEARGTQITVFMDKNKLFSGDDSRLQNGRLGFMMDYGTKVKLDDVNVWVFEQ